ncbi:MAG TPA: sensor domain-containing diguanylate cyclase [Pyrinomonadaceae bacterium]|nr:sensor domain-containing diguanylate cyclase [Pyrinomonadaceae bacterium]
MKKQVVLLSSAEAAPTLELIESLSSSGIAVRIEGLQNAELLEEEFFSAAENFPLTDPTAILYEVAPEARVEELHAVIELSRAKWPGVPVVASRRSSERTGALNSAPRDAALKRLGFRAVADRPAQLAALLRQVEEGPGTGELKLPPEFKSPLDSRAFSLPASVRGEHLRGALALLSSLHLASNQKEAGQAALAGIARLVAASRWAIFVTAQTGGVDSLNFESLVGRSISDGASLRFDEDWRRELLSDPEIPNEPESKSARAAATRIETIRKIERGRRVIALPLVSGERVLGVLEGVRAGAGARQFSATETSLLAALAIPIASALAHSVRIAEAERLSLTDDLTKLHNARYLRQFLVNEIKRARRYKSNVAALFLDLDDFKRVNDVHGHLVGSHALMEVAAVILPSVRDTDCVVRYGGDEFVVILPETGIDEAVQVADRIRATIEQHRFTGGRRLKMSLTASFGIAVLPQHALSPQQLIACADTAMYEAKAADKNCVRVIAGPSVAAPDEVPNPAPVGISQFQRIPDEKLIS